MLQTGKPYQRLAISASSELLMRGTKLGEDYYRFVLPIVQRQLAKAGVRVVAVLDEIFR